MRRSLFIGDNLFTISGRAMAVNSLVPATLLEQLSFCSRASVTAGWCRRLSIVRCSCQQQCSTYSTIRSPISIAM